MAEHIVRMREVEHRVFVGRPEGKAEEETGSGGGSGL